ncbi:MAG: carbohydrate ABC transporter permease [Sphaerochaetaceae bacterium]
MNKRKIIPSIVLYFILCFTIALVLLPLVLLFVSSLRPGTELMRNGLNLSIDFATASFKNYRLLFSGENSYFTWYKNSMLITFLQVALSLFLSACVGYSFAIYEFKGKNFFFSCVLLLMMVPTEIIMLPLYRLTVRMGNIDTITGIVLPYLVIPMLIFFFRQYLSGIPKDFLDAARIDGCSEYGIFGRIMLPLMKPSFAAMGIYEGMQSWNNFLWPMIVIRSSSHTTLPVGLAGLITPYGNNYDILIAGSCFAIVPILILFICFQSYFIDGMTAGGVKG